MEQIDINSLTLGEIATVEKFSGLSIDSLGEAGTPKGMLFAAMVYVLEKRKNPDFTFEDALNMDITKIESLFGTPDDEDPKE